MMEKQEEQIEAQAGWASLPRDVAWEIFRRLRHVDILRGAGLACASWRQLAADEPALWRSIDVAFDKDDDGEERPFLARLAMGRAAVDRSAGRCESFRGPADRHLLVYLADRYYFLLRKIPGPLHASSLVIKVRTYKEKTGACTRTINSTYFYVKHP